MFKYAVSCVYTYLQADYVQDSGIDKILLLTDHPHPRLILLSLSISDDGILALTQDGVVDLEEPGAHPSEFLIDIVVDHSATAVVAISHAQRFKVVLLENGEFGENFDVS